MEENNEAPEVQEEIEYRDKYLIAFFMMLKIEPIRKNVSRRALAYVFPKADTDLAKKCIDDQPYLKQYIHTIKVLETEMITTRQTSREIEL